MAYSLRSIAKGSFLFASGQVLTKASAFFLIPLYTRFLSPDDYGIVGYLQFILQILSTILIFGFHGAQARYFYQHKNEPTVIGEYLFSINAWLICILFTSAISIVFGGIYLYNIIGPDDIPFNPYIPIIAWTILFQVMNQLAISYWVVRKEYLKSTLLNLVLFFLTTGFAIYFVVGLEMGAEGKVRALLYGQAVFFAFAYWAYARHFIFRIKWHYIAYSLSFGVPIVIHLLAGTLHASIDRALLADMVSISELGLYTLGYQVGLVMSIVTSSVNQAWQPSYYELMESQDIKKDYHIQRTYNIWLIVMSLICILGILWGGDILKMIVPDHFYGATKVIPYVILGYFFNGLYFFGVSPIFFYKKTKILPWCTGASAGVNIVLNLVLIPHFGITGAAMATTFSMLFQAIIIHLFGKKLHDHGLNIKATVMISIFMALSFIAPLRVDDVILSHSLRAAFLTVLCLMLFSLFKQDIAAILISVKQKCF